MQPEAQFKRTLDRAFDKQAGQLGWRTALEKGRGQRSGLPDRLYCLPHVGHAWVEAKVDDNKLSPLQDKGLRLLSASGMRAYVVTFYPAADSTAWCYYGESGEPQAGYTFVPLATVRTLMFWHLLLKGTLATRFDKL